MSIYAKNSNGELKPIKINVNGIQGPKGDKGDIGPQGPTGPKGDKGENGLTTSIKIGSQTFTQNEGLITLTGIATENFVTTKISEAQLSGTTASNFIVDAFLLINDVIFTKDFNTLSITINLNKKIVLNRIMCVSWSNGSTTNEGFTDGITIPKDNALYWDKNNQFTIEPYSSGIKTSYNKILVGLNWNGRITAGLLAPIWEKYHKYTNKALFDKERYISTIKEVSRDTSKTLHSMTVVGNELWTLECYKKGDFDGKCQVYSLPDLTYKSTFYQHIEPPKEDGSIINLRLVCADYNSTQDCLLLGSGTADGSDYENMEAYIFYNASNLKNFTDKNNPITLNNTDNTIIDFHKDKLFPSGNITAKLVWSELPDIIYLTHDNLKYCYKIQLGVGTNKLEYGTYSYSESKRYNGTFRIIQNFTQEDPEVGNKDVQYYNGYLYYPVKYTTGGYRIYKTSLKHDGSMHHEMLIYDPISDDGSHAITGSPEGFVIYDNKIICSHATYGKFYIFDANI